MPGRTCHQTTGDDPKNFNKTTRFQKKKNTFLNKFIIKHRILLGPKDQDMFITFLDFRITKQVKTCCQKKEFFLKIEAHNNNPKVLQRPFRGDMT